MRRAVARIFAPVAAAGLVFGGCAATPEWHGSRLVFPATTRPTTLILRDPLVLREGVSIVAQVSRFSDGASSLPLWLTVDTGATGVVLPQATINLLGLAPIDHLRASLSDAAGHLRESDVVRVPSLILGDLALHEVMVEPLDEYRLLGQAVLSHTPWELDWDRGTLTLDAPEWPGDAADVVNIPLTRASGLGDTDTVVIAIDGAPYEMILDTGALASALPESLGRRLVPHELPFPMRERLPGGAVTFRRVFEGATSIGSAQLGARTFVAVPDSILPRGNLGLDLLMRFRVRVVPGKTLSLRPREDLWQMAPARIARWPWTAGCEHAACATAHIHATGGDATLTLAIERPEGFPMPVELILGCPADPAPVTSAPQIMSSGGKLSIAGVHHLVARVAPHVTGAEVATVRWGGRLWFSAGGAACEELGILDVVPLSSDGLGPDRVTATLY